VAADDPIGDEGAELGPLVAAVLDVVERGGAHGETAAVGRRTTR
jgi:hypothetical protein